MIIHWVFVSAGSPSRGGDVAVYAFDINQPSLPTPFHSVLVSVSVFMAFSTVFHSINSLDNSQLSHSVLLVLYLPYWSFQLYISFIKVSLSSDITLCAWLGLKHQLTNYGCVSRKKKWNCKTFRRQVFFGCGRISYIQASFKTRCFLICCYCTMY